MNAVIPTFSSFLMAGFESTYALAENRRRLDLLAATKHDVRVREDYALILEHGIKTVRESLSWSQIDKGDGAYDFSRFERMMAAGKEMGVQQIWGLNHFDFPDDVDVFSPALVERFAAYAREVVTVIRKYSDEILYLIPINEMSFMAWIGADRGWWAPYTTGSGKGFEMKKNLVRAAIAGMEAIWSINENVRFIQTDPFMRRVATEPASVGAKKHAKQFNEVIRFEVWDMLSGKAYPEIGGDPKYLDIIGMNYYIHNQEWVISQKGQGRRLTHQMMDWESPDRISFAKMIEEVHERYGRPMIVSETGSFGEHRQAWWQRTLNEVDEARTELNLPVAGVCIYPVLDRPEDAGFLLPHSGVWDFDMDDSDCLRCPHQPSLEVIDKFLHTRLSSPI